MYFPAISYLRSQVIPESHRANVMNWFRWVKLGLTGLLIFTLRVPMNVVTCGALLCLHVDTISQDKRIVFAACLLLCIIGNIQLYQLFIVSWTLLFSGTLLSQKFELTFRDSNGSKKQSNDGEVDVKSGKKLQ